MDMTTLLNSTNTLADVFAVGTRSLYVVAEQFHGFEGKCFGHGSGAFGNVSLDGMYEGALSSM